MKRIFFLMLILTFNNIYSQRDSLFWKRILIGKSMETAEQKEKPAQFQITIPKDSTSWLVDFGISYKINNVKNQSSSKIILEYHKNTIVDKKQNNFQLGFGRTQFLGSNEDTNGFYINSDLKYVYDGIDVKNSFASNLLFTYYKESDNGLSINAPNVFDRSSIFLSAFGGIQMQGIFKAKDDLSQGFIVRPQYVLALQYNFNDTSDIITPKPIFRLSIDYTGRYDILNSTEYKENYTHLFTAGAEFFIAYKPVKVSLGGSFNYGSDPLRGLKQQQFWLFSLNFMKDKK